MVFHLRNKPFVSILKCFSSILIYLLAIFIIPTVLNQFRKSDSGKDKLPESREETKPQIVIVYGHLSECPLSKVPMCMPVSVWEHGARRRLEVFKLMFHFVCNLVCE